MINKSRRIRLDISDRQDFPKRAHYIEFTAHFTAYLETVGYYKDEINSMYVDLDDIDLLDENEKLIEINYKDLNKLADKVKGTLTWE